MREVHVRSNNRDVSSFPSDKAQRNQVYQIQIDHSQCFAGKGLARGDIEVLMQLLGICTFSIASEENRSLI